MSYNQYFMYSEIGNDKLSKGQIKLPRHNSLPLINADIDRMLNRDDGCKLGFSLPQSVVTYYDGQGKSQPINSNSFIIPDSDAAIANPMRRQKALIISFSSGTVERRRFVVATYLFIFSKLVPEKFGVEPSTALKVQIAQASPSKIL